MSTMQARLERCLSILRRLQAGPADREVLMAHVNIDLGADAYPPDSEKVFEKDVGYLRDVLQVDLPNYDRTKGVYEFLGFGHFLPLCLQAEELDALAFLAETFGPDAPNSDAVQRLLLRVQDLLVEAQRNALITRRQRLKVDLRRKDANTIHPAVEDAVNRALGRRLLQFAYLSPSQADGVPRIHIVEPWNRFFDPARGHEYLDAYWRRYEGPYGPGKPERWQKFRLDSILATDDLQVLPDKLPPTPPKRPNYTLEYLLAPTVARRGVTRHFMKMHVHEADEEGWVRVTAVTHDLFAACRLLLTYGPNCRVTGGMEARREMEALVRGMVEVYKKE